MSYASVILADSPIRYWQLRETTGDTATDSMEAFDGAYTPSSGGSWTGGMHNQGGPMVYEAPVFNGTDGYIAVGDVPIDGLAHASFEFFVKIRGAGKDYQSIFSKFDTALIRCEISTGGAGFGSVLGLIVGIDNGVTYTGAVFLADTWYHCVAVYDGTLAAADRVKIYVNGSLVAASTNAATPAAIAALTTTDTYIGVREGSSYHWEDYLAEIAVYDVSLTSTQVTAHYNAYVAEKPMFTADVHSTGVKVDLVFTGAVTIASSDFMVVADEIVIELDTETGAGTTWSLPIKLNSGWIPVEAAVRVTRLSIQTSVPASNGSSYTRSQKRYVQRGFGIFVHLVGSTFAAVTTQVPLTLENVEDMLMEDYDMEQWFTSVVVPSGARYAVFTAKHWEGVSWWPTEGDNWNVAQTGFGAANPGADLCRDWVRLAKKYNMPVGFYLCFGDMWWLNTGPGVVGGYNHVDYPAYMNQQITELFSNYGKIDMLWCDLLNQAVTFTQYPWSNVTDLRDALQPDCVLLNNTREENLAHADIVTLEGPAGAIIPSSSNTVPTEWTEDSRTDESYIWNASNDSSYKNIYSIAGKVLQCKAGRTAYLLNFPPNKFGLMPTSSGTYAAQLGAMIGTQGPEPVLPSTSNVRAGIDRGDGEIGAFGGGINSSAILGVV